jgi:2-methylcitrate dehydratase PrpD
MSGALQELRHAPPTGPEGPTGRLALWLSTQALGDIPEQVRERAKYLLLDGIGCALVGARLPWSRSGVEATLRLEGEGCASLIGWGRKTNALSASLLNSSFVQGFELDDFHPLAPVHGASLVLPSLLACAETIDAAGAPVSGADFLRAAILGFEVGPRVGLALNGSEMLARGWHSGEVFGTFSSAVAAGALLGLDASGFEDALGLAATQSAGLMAAQFESMGKRMQHGFASRNGLHAAFLAAGKYTGIKRVFEREYGGFLSTFGEGHAPDASRIVEGLGRNWETERIVVKPYAAMGGLHSALDALFELKSQREISPAEIDSIDIGLSEAVYKHGWWKLERPLSPISAQMNIAYAIAVAILDGEAMARQFAPQRIDRDDVWELIPKISAHRESDFDTKEKAGSVRLRIRLAGGTVLEKFQRAPKSIESPMTKDEVAAKFRLLAADLIDPEAIAEIEDTIRDLERVKDMAGLSSLLAKPARALFDKGDEDDGKMGGRAP